MSRKRVLNSQITWLLLIGTLCLGCGKPSSKPEVVQSQHDSTPVVEKSPDSEPANIEESVAKTEAAEVEPESEAIAATPSEESTTEETPDAAAEEETEPEFEEMEPEIARLPPPEGADPMPEPNLVWIDRKLGTVMVDGYVSLREGMLEMFACPVGSKEHESIVAVYSQAQIVHAALLAVGAEVGSPVQFNPDFKPPTGTEIAVEVHWLDEEGNWQATDAQQWILDIKTNKPMTHPWVFAGSGFWKDEETGEEFYMAESGDFICVSNFSSATLDIPVESSQVNEGLLFEANPAKVPPVGTPVRLVLKPKKK